MPLSPCHVGPVAALLLAVVALSQPVVVAAHADLESSDPAGGATVPGPFGGPIVLVYSEGLQSGSHAELLAPGGGTVAEATIDPTDATRLMFTLETPLDAGSWTIQWTSVAADRDVERGQVAFTVAAPTPSPTPLPTAAPTAAPTAPPTVTSSPSPTRSPGPSSSPADPSPASATDVIVPIVTALALVAVAGALLLRRRGPA